MWMKNGVSSGYRQLAVEASTLQLQDTYTEQQGEGGSLLTIFNHS